MNKQQLLFFTACSGRYKQFLIPYIYFAQKFNPNSAFEIVVDKTSDQIQSGCEYLKQQFNLLIEVYEQPNNIPGQFLRFLLTPKTKCQYTYIGDIDILILENILPFHMNQLQKFQTLFDNQIRINDPTRLTGLHFVQYDYFNQVQQAQQKYINTINQFKDVKEYSKINDEEMLFDICKESKLKFPPISLSEKEMGINRPVHGLHFSLNRKPFKSDSHMSFKCSDIYKQKFFDVLHTDEYKSVEQHFDENFRKNLEIALNFIN